jgi:hypothetical protein
MTRSTVISSISSILILGSAGSAFAIGFSLTPIGGSTTGRVGDTLVVGIDLTLEAGEYVTIAAPALLWDLEGGNVLDVRSAHESGITVGNFELNPLQANRWSIWDPTKLDDLSAASLGTYIDETPTVFQDAHLGSTLFYGFEQASIVLDENEIVTDILSNGIQGSGTYRVGTIEFLLQQVGTTELNYYTDPTNGLRTFIAGSRGTEFPGDQVTLTPLEISAESLVSLQITVIPEPGSALLLGLGLFGLASCRSRAIQGD